MELCSDSEASMGNWYRHVSISMDSFCCVNILAKIAYLGDSMYIRYREDTYMSQFAYFKVYLVLT
jgi:hypothetical protein